MDDFDHMFDEQDSKEEHQISIMAFVDSVFKLQGLYAD